MMIKGISRLLFVIVIVVLVAFVTELISHFFGVTNLYSLIDHFIEMHESV